MAEKPGGAYIDDLPDAAAGQAYYDLGSTCDEYLAFHYPDGDPLSDLLGPRAPVPEDRYPFAVRRLWRARPAGRALDIGAAAGRVTFDLARDHRVAFGIDFSAPLIRAARRVRDEGRARYVTVVEGRLVRAVEVVVKSAPNASFAVADALALPFPDGCFDTVVALNLVDRVPDPARALDEAARVLAPGGRLLVGSPYTWLETFTPPARWLGGFRRDGRAVRGAEAVRARFAGGFRILDEVRLPFFIPHHARSGQLGVSHIHVIERET